MRLDSAPSRSAFSLPRSVTRKRLVVSNPCPTRSSVAGSISGTHVPALVMSARCVPKSAASSATVTPKPMPAPRRGSTTMR
jgi:hypothetical protein